MFKYDPSKANFNSRLKEGDAIFRIERVMDKNKDGGELLSKKGVPMLCLELSIYDAKNTHEKVFDYIVATYPKKLQDLYNAIGHPEWFVSGQLEPASLEGYEGKCHILIRPDNQGNDRASVESYTSQVKEEFSDEIPF